jgi:excinuclease ABC subunit C
LPTAPGVYIFEDREGSVIYVGKANNLRERVRSYFRDNSLFPKTSALVSQIEKVKFIKVLSEIESLLLEANLIQNHKPKYNVRFMDGKAYPFIKITVKEKYPAVIYSRHITDKKSLYFGPYPNIGTVRQILKTVRRIFPYKSSKSHPKKACLYYHLGLCPCPEVFGDGSYKKNIRHIANFLRGNTKKVVKDLEKEKEEFVKKEEFEKAGLVQKKINAIYEITNPINRPYYYEINPNLSSDIREKEVQDLKEVLAKQNIELSIPRRIECFDISNIGGKFATGSMVVFINGEKYTTGYRRFRVRVKTPKANDYLMMEEVLRRRLTHKEWDFPDLLIVDGGKGQVSTASKVLKDSGVNIPVIGLAKRLETIITPEFNQINLQRRSPALQLIMRVRDEAHRFAVTYHRKLRSNYLLETI